MDQDFHYYGTYYAARRGGFDQDEATLIAKASNFIDFFNQTTYAAYWKLVSQTEKSDNYDVVAQLDYPRYTFQGGFLSPLLSPEDGLWCSYHFTPGNYDDPPNTPSREMVHGQSVADYLPKFETRDTTQGRAILEKYNPESLGDLELGKLLNRPQSALSRQLIMDTLKCAASDARLESILGYAIGGQVILRDNREDNLRRFKLILLGIRAHVIADTWAHQDFCGLNNVMNTYWDVKYDPTSWNPFEMGYGRQSIDYDDGTTSDWRNQVLSGLLMGTNFEAVPNGTSCLGHSWMGHLPDFSFVKFRYKPCWADPSTATERNNPQQYQSAWVELVSLFTQVNGSGQLELDEQFRNDLNKAIEAIQNPCQLVSTGTGRKSSANAWQHIFGDLPSTNIDADSEPDPKAVLDGAIEMTKSPDRYGTNYISINSDLYLFQIAADYHFHFVKDYLERHGIYRFTGSWSQQISALSPDVSSLFDAEGHFDETEQFGGSGGSTFRDSIPQSVQITQITIWSGTEIDAIQTTWKSAAGKTFTGAKHGGSGGGSNTISLENGEYITQIDGRSGRRVDQLTFTTNLGKIFGPFGGNGGHPFTITNLQVRGFVGRSGNRIDALGVISPL